MLLLMSSVGGTEDSTRAPGGSPAQEGPEDGLKLCSAGGPSSEQIGASFLLPAGTCSGSCGGVLTGFLST